MAYSWETSFNNVKLTGMARVIELIKLGLKEIPRLHKEFLLKTNERYIVARREVLAIFDRLDREITQARLESGMSEGVFLIALRNPANYTPEEQEALTSLPALLKLYGIDIFNRRPTPSPTKKRKRNPPFKV